MITMYTDTQITKQGQEGQRGLEHLFINNEDKTKIALRRLEVTGK